jgi:hypothetical protein
MWTVISVINIVIKCIVVGIEAKSLRLYSQHFNFFVIYKWVQKARMFAPENPFQPTLTFVSKARAYLSEAPFRWSILVYSSLLVPRINDKEKCFIPLTTGTCTIKLFTTVIIFAVL